jgi:hypothetical protein
MKKAVMVNVLVQVILEVDADNDEGAKEIAKDYIESLCDIGFGHEEALEYSIIQNNVVWITESENMS